MRSLIGNAINRVIDCDFRVFSFLRNPASFSLLVRLLSGAVIQMLPVCLILRPFFFTRLRPVVDLLMPVPKNFALSVLALVMRVFSIESSRFNVRRNSPRKSFRSWAFFLVPHMPIIQSSAYLTYSSRAY